MLQNSNIFCHERPLLIRALFTTYILGTLSLPLFGLVTCVFISFVFHFEDSTGTHCQVPNYLPSISASISLSPESQIWRFCIGLHSAPRIMVAFSYFRFYKAYFSSRFLERALSYVTLAISACENLGLLLLTYVSSSETYFVHKGGFVLFIISSFIYMLTTCCLWKSIIKYSLSPKDAKSFRWKVRFSLLNVAFCLLAALFYWKHNVYCESGSYTFFALFEYLVVFSNMAFHLTSVWDFQSQEIMVTSIYEEKNF